MIPSLRGSMSAQQCWFVQLNAEYILATTIVGISPVVIILSLYSSILFKALQKIGELKAATSAPNGGASTSNNLRYFTGSANNVLNRSEAPETSRAAAVRQHDEEELTGLQKNQTVIKSIPKRWLCCCCWNRPPQSDEFKNEPHQSSRQPSKWKAIKVVMFTTGAFIITWVPYFIASTLYVYCDHENNPQFCNGLKTAIASPLAILGFANSLLNPIIYAWWHTGFRTHSLRIYSKRFENVKFCKWIFANRSKNAPAATSSTSGTSAGESNSTRMTSSTHDSNNVTRMWQTTEIFNWIHSSCGD